MLIQTVLLGAFASSLALRIQSLSLALTQSDKLSWQRRQAHERRFLQNYQDEAPRRQGILVAKDRCPKP